ncbi:MAG: ATP-binding protein [Chloroflexota bacterium]
MSEKFNKVTQCPGKTCTGYIYQWQGPQNSWERDGFVPVPCPICDKGQVAKGALQAKEASEALAEAERRLKQRLASFNLPTRLTGFSFDSYLASANGKQEWVKYAAHWLDQWPGCHTGLVLAGDMGRGKTGLAVGMVCQLASQLTKLTAYYINVANLLTQISGAWARRDGSECLLIDRLSTVDLLVLDDLGAGHRAVEGDERSPIRHLYEVLDTRYNYSRPTILTTNCKTEAAMMAVIGERNMDRVMDHCKFLKVTGSNLRQGVR